MYSRPFFSERRVYGSLFARVVALIDEISTKRIHIEQIRRNVLSISVVEEGPVTPFLCGGIPLTFGGIH